MMTHQTYMLGAMLRIPFQAIVERIYAELMEAGYTDLRSAHFVVFQQRKPQGVRAIDLADKAQITKQSMSYLINYLETAGYLEKISDPSDGRAQLIRLTEKGADVERIARDAIAQLQTEWEGILGEERMKDLFLTLDLLVSHIEQGKA